jgi:hypothetical protein
MSKEVAFMVNYEEGRERGGNGVYMGAGFDDGRSILAVEEIACRKETAGQSCIRMLILAENFCRGSTDEGRMKDLEGKVDMEPEKFDTGMFVNRT